MKRERMIEILAEAHITPKTKHHSYDYLYNQTLTAMQRAVEEETARLKQCEAIVRDLADDDDFLALADTQDTARQWVKNNPK